jgi:hypothetical protein
LVLLIWITKIEIKLLGKRKFSSRTKLLRAAASTSTSSFDLARFAPVDAAVPST